MCSTEGTRGGCGLVALDFGTGMAGLGGGAGGREECPAPSPFRSVGYAVTVGTGGGERGERGSETGGGGRAETVADAKGAGGAGAVCGGETEQKDEGEELVVDETQLEA